MSWWLSLLLVLASAGLALVVIASRKPNVFRIERRILLAASPATIFPYLDSLEAWQSWSPWARKDPNMRTTYGPQRAGLGASTLCGVTSSAWAQEAAGAIVLGVVSGVQRPPAVSK